MQRFLQRIFILILAATSAARADDLVLKNVNIVDVDRGTIVSGRAVLISDGQIKQIDAADSIQPPAQGQVVDAGGRYLMPALWDMHIHPGGVEDLTLLIANGVGGARIMAGTPEHLAWRARIELGELLGPRLLIAGPIVEGLPPPNYAGVVDLAGDRLVRTEADGIAEVRKQKAAGFDYIKVYNNVPLDAYRGLVAEAARQRMLVIGHVPFAVGLLGVFAAHQASVEHLRGYPELLVPKDAPLQPGVDLRSRILSWEYADLSRVPALVRAARVAGAWQVPTLSTRIYQATPDELSRYRALPEAVFLDAEIRFELEHRDRVKWLSNFSAGDFARAARGDEKQNALLRAMQHSGVRLLAGTDIGPWGFSLHGELQRLEEAGLSPAEVLRTVTVNPARFAGLQAMTGRVAVNYAADLVVLDANPLEDIRNTRKIHAVIVRGRLLDRTALDGLLANVKAKYARETRRVPTQ